MNSVSCVLTNLSYLWFAARVRLIHAFRDIPDKASHLVAFGPRGEALVESLDYLSHRGRNDLSLYRLEDTGGKYRRTVERKIAKGVGMGCQKAVTDRNIYFQININGPTFQLDASDMSTITTLHHEGDLHGCVHPEALVYGVERSEEWIMYVHDETGVVTLQPPKPRRWNKNLSACRAGQHIIVVETTSRSLDVFTATGNIQHFVHDSDEWPNSWISKY